VPAGKTEVEPAGKTDVLPGPPELGTVTLVASDPDTGALAAWVGFAAVGDDMADSPFILALRPALCFWRALSIAS
jgi:hypothetical protein